MSIFNKKKEDGSRLLKRRKKNNPTTINVLSDYFKDYISSVSCYYQVITPQPYAMSSLSLCLFAETGTDNPKASSQEIPTANKR